MLRDKAIFAFIFYFFDFKANKAFMGRENQKRLKTTGL